MGCSVFFHCFDFFLLTGICAYGDDLRQSIVSPRFDENHFLTDTSLNHPIGTLLPCGILAIEGGSRGAIEITQGLSGVRKKSSLGGTEEVEAEYSRSASALCPQDTINLLTDLSKLRVEFLQVLAKRGRRADLDHRTASGVRGAVVQVAPLTGCKVEVAASIDENPV
jgi:hypothetical protein